MSFNIKKACSSCRKYVTTMLVYDMTRDIALVGVEVDPQEIPNSSLRMPHSHVTARK